MIKDIILYGLADSMAAAQLQTSVAMIKGVKDVCVNHNVSRMTINIPNDQWDAVIEQVYATIAVKCPNVEPKM